VEVTISHKATPQHLSSCTITHDPHDEQIYHMLSVFADGLQHSPPHQQPAKCRKPALAWFDTATATTVTFLQLTAAQHYEALHM